MDSAEIERRIIQLLREKVPESGDLTGNFIMLGDEGAFDSVTALELLLALEKESASSSETTTCSRQISGTWNASLISSSRRSMPTAAEPHAAHGEKQACTVARGAHPEGLRWREFPEWQLADIPITSLSGVST